MYNVRLCQSDSDQIVHVSGEALETGLVAHEAVYVDAQELPAPLRVRLVLELVCIVAVGGCERLRRRRARVVLRGPIIAVDF